MWHTRAVAIDTTRAQRQLIACALFAVNLFVCALDALCVFARRPRRHQLTRGIPPIVSMEQEKNEHVLCVCVWLLFGRAVHEAALK